MAPRLSPLAVCLLVLFAGCAGVPSGGGETATPMPTPETPSVVTNETARQYAAADAEARRFNRVVERGAINSSLGCDGYVVTALDDRSVTLVHCTGGIRFSDGTHSDNMFQYLYWITDEGVRRVTNTSGGHRFEATSRRRSGFGLYNFDDRGYNVTVDLVRPPTGTPITELRYRLGPERGVRQYLLPTTAVDIRYRITLEKTNETLTFRWQPPDHDEWWAGGGGPRLVIYVTPDGRIEYGLLPADPDH